MRLFRWLVFNFLIGNNDNHLKNVSFLQSADGVEIAPFYDLLSTQAWATKAMASENATRPNEALTLSLGNAKIIRETTLDDPVAAGRVLGLAKSTCMCELNVLVRDVPVAAQKLLVTLEEETKAVIARSPEPDEARKHAAGDLRLLRTIVGIIIEDTSRLLALPTARQATSAKQSG